MKNRISLTKKYDNITMLEKKYNKTFQFWVYYNFNCYF